jgi:hypothetical protein
MKKGSSKLKIQVIRWIDHKIQIPFIQVAIAISNSLKEIQNDLIGSLQSLFKIKKTCFKNRLQGI